MMIEVNALMRSECYFDCESHGVEVSSMNRRESGMKEETAEVSVVFPPCARESEARRWT